MTTTTILRRGYTMTAAICLSAATALAAPPITTTMQVSVSPSAITPGGSATVTATVTPNSGTINCGNGQIQYRIYDALNLVRVDWTQLANNLTVSSNQFSVIFDTATIPVAAGERVAFRAGYASDGSGCAFQNQAIGLSPTADLLVTAADYATCPNGQTTGVFISIEDPNGNGAPRPGESGPWSFVVKVKACESVYDVTAQGGANGWAPLKSYSPAAANVVENVKNKNTVYLWTIGNLAQGQEAALTITVDGAIKNSAGECGKVKQLNGDWSSLYATTPGGVKTKSAYTTYTTTIQVTCP
jgi:hypothetical protein